MERLEVTLNRLMEDIESSTHKFIRINPHTIIKQEDINYIKKDGMKLIFCTNSQDYETYNSFNKIQSILPDNFVRCHKSYIVNTDSIQNIDNYTNEIVFQNHSTCGIGPKYKNNLMEVFNYGNFSSHLDSTNN